ncbi:MAG: hypothetical protein NTY83_03725, partial [Candidatus Micrarchaeota archaeon]|nr:hypothetical protein [Candidatus Micrarchaeota archaeon]
MTDVAASAMQVEPQLAEAPPEEPAEGAIPELTLSWRIPPKRQITLNELMGEMERVIKYDSAERPKKVAAQMPTLELDLDNYDIESEIDKLYVRLKGGADSEGIVLFSSLINGGGAEEVVSAITPLLHLAQRKSICLRQDKFFGEIFINLSGDETNGKEGNGMAETGAASHREAMRKEGNGKNAEADSLPEPEDAELEAGEAEMGSGAEGEGA